MNQDTIEASGDIIAALLMRLTTVPCPEVPHAALVLVDAKHTEVLGVATMKVMLERGDLRSTFTLGGIDWMRQAALAFLSEAHRPRMLRVIVVNLKDEPQLLWLAWPPSAVGSGPANDCKPADAG